MSERVAHATRFGVRAGVWGLLWGVCWGAVSVLVVGSHVRFTFPELVGHFAVISLGWSALIFVLTFALAYAFPSPGIRIEFPGADKLVALLLGLVFLATAVLAWLVVSSQMP